MEWTKDMNMECLWYNGGGQYELLDFDPNGLDEWELKEKIVNELRMLHVDEDWMPKALASVYLVKVDGMRRVFKEDYTHIHHLPIK